MNQPCKHCGEYHSCTDLIEQQADRIAELEKGLELVKDAYCARDSECRQLKGRIAELEKQVVIWEKATMDARIKSAVEKQSEPVAWRVKNPQQFNEYITFASRQDADLYAFHNGKGHLPEPLYTTPQTKPLSDEEIIKIFNQIWVDGGNTNGVMHRFARAIEAKVKGEK